MTVNREVNPQLLDSLLTGNADRIVVVLSPADDTVLFQSSDRNDIQSFSDALNLDVPSEYFHCMCIGTPEVRIYEQGQLIASVTNHHGMSVRCSLWESDAPITNPELWLAWFDERGIDGPRAEVDQLREQATKSKSQWETWLSVIPVGLQNEWQLCYEGSSGTTNRDAMDSFRRLLLERIPNEKNRILSLLSWFGSGSGRWSGYPAYENTVEQLLFDYPIEQIITAIRSKTLVVPQLEGAARFFGGWTFSKTYPKGLKSVPKDIKLQLWNHVKNTDDEDKLGRASRAFNRG